MTTVTGWWTSYHATAALTMAMRLVPSTQVHTAKPATLALRAGLAATGKPRVADTAALVMTMEMGASASSRVHADTELSMSMAFGVFTGEDERYQVSADLVMTASTDTAVGGVSVAGLSELAMTAVMDAIVPGEVQAGADLVMTAAMSATGHGRVAAGDQSLYYIAAGEDLVAHFFEMVPGGETVEIDTTGMVFPFGVTVGVDGMIYVADVARKCVHVIGGAGGQELWPITGSVGGPGLIAVAPSGGVFVSMPWDGVVLRFDAGVASVVPLTGLVLPLGVAVDAAGVLYVSDVTANTVVTLDDGTQSTVPFTDLDTPAGVAVDAQGRVFVVSGFDVLRWDGDTQAALGFTGIESNGVVAVDAAGVVYTTTYDATHDRVDALDGDVQTTLLAVAKGSLRGWALGPARNTEIAFTITVDHTLVGDDITGYGLSVDLADMPETFWNLVRGNGGDIRCNGPTGDLPREVAAIDTATRTGQLWIRTSLSTTTDTIIAVTVDGKRRTITDTDPLGKDAVWDGIANPYEPNPVGLYTITE